jgi:Rod binding domain-containing protein
MAVSSIGDTYLTNYSTTASDSVSEQLTSQIQSASTDEETLEACQEFESYMIEQMFKTMEETAKVFSDDDDEDDSSDYVDMFQDNYLSTIAEQMVSSGQGLGIAEQLYESIKNNTGTSAVTETAAAVTASEDGSAAAQG